MNYGIGKGFFESDLLCLMHKSQHTNTGPLIEKGAAYFNIRCSEPLTDFRASLSERQKLVESKAVCEGI